MYVKKKKREQFQLNLDSLMDILTCSVGVMLFVVIFTVLQARGTNIKVLTPMLRDPPENSKRLIFICKNSFIKPLDVSAAINQITDKKKITYFDIPKIVKKANDKNIHDDYFSYKFSYDEHESNSYFSSFVSRSIDISIDTIEWAFGETVDELKSQYSKYANRIKALDKDSVWISFLVDKESLDVFRKAREAALENGFSVGWVPDSTSFPLKACILGCEDESSNEELKSLYDQPL